MECLDKQTPGTKDILKKEFSSKRRHKSIEIGLIR